MEISLATSLPGGFRLSDHAIFLRAVFPLRFVRCVQRSRSILCPISCPHSDFSVRMIRSFRHGIFLDAGNQYPRHAVIPGFGYRFLDLSGIVSNFVTYILLVSIPLQRRRKTVCSRSTPVPEFNRVQDDTSKNITSARGV